ncbi:MAG: tellurite resistance protein permease [Gemmatimonadota bacterium]
MTTATAESGLAVFRDEVRTLSPAYFALVMATGIVSVAALRVGMTRVAFALLAINAVAYAVLCVMTALRVLWYPSAFLDDLTDHRRGVGFFSLVAGTCVLGSQGILIAGGYRAATLLLGAGIVLWITLTYAIFTVLAVKRDKPALADGITGSWLLAVVATQSIAVLSALLASHWGQPQRLHANFLALSMWLWGGMLYIWMISLIFYRYMFFRFSPDDLEPPYWINMGAMAISTLGGATLISNARDAWFLQSLLPFLEGFTILFWATGSWWVPMLAILFAWRHGYRRLPLRYDPLYWGAVFPLGMYSVCTSGIADVMRLEFLAFIPRIFAYVALSAWCLAALGLARRIGGVLRRMRTRGGADRTGYRAA